MTRSAGRRQGFLCGLAIAAAVIAELGCEAADTAEAAVYYVNAETGNDTNPGTMDRPWRSIEKVNAGRYGPGDRIPFRAGQTFAGSLYFDAPRAGGTTADPVAVGSYGEGTSPMSMRAGSMSRATASASS